MTGPRSPAALALTDQAAVAARDGAEIFTALAGHLHATISDSAPTGPVAGLLRKFTTHYLTGISYCPHLTQSAGPSWWLPAKPGRLRCLTCTQHASGTNPRHRDRCDHCNRVRNPLQSGVLLIPPIVLEDLTGTATAVGPVVVIYQLCQTCHAATADPPPPEDG